MVHVSRSPPLIPDSRISRVRLAAAAFPRGPSQSSRSLSARTHTPLSTSVRPPARRVRQSNRYLVQCPDDDRAPRPLLTESLFAQRRRYPRWGELMVRLGRYYSAFLAPIGSCARPDSSLRLCIRSSARSLQVAASPCWKVVLPDVISTICVWVPEPIPRRAPSVLLPVSSRGTSASP